MAAVKRGNKVPLTLDIQKELSEMIEDDAGSKGISKADIVRMILYSHYNFNPAKN